jgi:atypical dual specificity phosphatase
VPVNFSWLVDGRVAGMARPVPADAGWLREQGVTAVLSLTERFPPPMEGLEVRHLPVRDMESPTLEQIRDAVAYMRAVVAAGGCVVAHCGAGMGRTGTILAAYLVGEGFPPERAIAEVRERRPGSIETLDQEETVFRYADMLWGGTP